MLQNLSILIGVLQVLKEINTALSCQKSALVSLIATATTAAIALSQSVQTTHYVNAVLIIGIGVLLVLCLLPTLVKCFVRAILNVQADFHHVRLRALS